MKASRSADHEAVSRVITGADRPASGGDVETVADLVAYEASHKLDGEEIESDPYGILRDHGRSIVADAAGNSLLRVTNRGHVSTLAVFPERLVEFQGEQVPMDAVPTSVVRGPDGAYYMASSRGSRSLSTARASTVWCRARRRGSTREGSRTSSTSRFDRVGNLYVLEIAHNSLRAAEPAGALIKVTPDGEKSILLDHGLFFPTSIALQGPRRLFVTNCGVCAGGGEIWQVDL